MRFFLITKVLFELRNMHDLREPGDKFAIKRPKAQARGDNPPTELEVRKAAAKREAASATRKEKKQERNEGHSDWNLETGDWNTAAEQVVKDTKLRKKAQSTKNWMDMFNR